MTSCQPLRCKDRHKSLLSGPGAGKHPSPLEKPKTNSPNHYLTVGFYRIKKYCCYQKLWRFSCDFLPAPIVIDRKFDVRDNPGAGKHPSPLEKPKTNSPNHYLTVGFYRIKKYCSYQKLWRFSCDFLPAPIDRKFDVRDNRHIWVLASTRALLEKKKKKKKKKKKTHTHTHKQIVLIKI